MDDPNQSTNPAAPVNDREFQAWEDGRRQGHHEATLAAMRAEGWMIAAPGCVAMPRSLEEAKAMSLLAEQYIRNARP